MNEPLPQSWVPRVLNTMIAVVLLLCLSPAVTRFGGLSLIVQITVVLFSLPVLLVAVLCLMSATRPGSVGRAFRRLAARRRSR